MYSDEIGANDLDGGKRIDALGDKWKEASTERGVSDFEIMNIEQEKENIAIKGTNSSVRAEVSLRNMRKNSSGIRGLEGYKNDFNFKVLKNINMQSNSLRPASLASPYPFFSDYSGDQESQNAVMFEFNEPVQSFGAWFADLETRTDGLGRIAYARMLNSNDELISEYNIKTSTQNQKLCGYPVNDSYTGCGKRTTRWIGFVSDTPKVKKFIVVVGDDDSDKGNNNGNSEHISFIGPTIGYKSDIYSINIFNDKNNNSVWDTDEAPMPSIKVKFNNQEVSTNNAGTASLKSASKKQIILKIDNKQFDSKYKISTGSTGGALNQTLSSQNPKGQDIGIYFPSANSAINSTNIKSNSSDISLNNNSAINKGLKNKGINEKIAEKTDNSSNKDNQTLKLSKGKETNKRDSGWLDSIFSKTNIIDEKNKNSNYENNTNVDKDKDRKEPNTLAIQKELLEMDDIILTNTSSDSNSKNNTNKYNNISLDKTEVPLVNNNTVNNQSPYSYTQNNNVAPVNNLVNNKSQSSQNQAGGNNKSPQKENIANNTLNSDITKYNSDNTNSGGNKSWYITMSIIIGIGVMAIIKKKIKTIKS